MLFGAGSPAPLPEGSESLLITPRSHLPFVLGLRPIFKRNLIFPDDGSMRFVKVESLLLDKIHDAMDFRGLPFNGSHHR